MRMQAYRLSLSLATGRRRRACAQQVASFERQPGAAAQRRPRAAAVRALGRHGARALRRRSSRTGPRFAAALGRRRAGRRWPTLRAQAAGFVDAHRRAGRRHRGPHVALDGAAAPAADRRCWRWPWPAARRCCYTGYRFVLEPVAQLEAGHRAAAGRRLQRARRAAAAATSSARWPPASTSMAEHLQSMYRNLEAKVRREDRASSRKSASAWQALYDVTHAGRQRDHARRAGAAASRSASRASRAPTAWRCAGPTRANQRYLLLASQGLPAAMVEARAMPAWPATAIAARRRPRPACA